MTRRLSLLLTATFLSLHPLPCTATCPGKVAVQVLGSGGPIADDARASSGYLLWIDGEARLLVDAGGGVFLRFGEAKARFETLDAIAITHFHADHSADLIAILKSGYFSERKRPLPIVGPVEGGDFPGLKGFLQALLDPERGAYRYLSGYLDGSGGLVKAEMKEMPVEGGPHPAFAGPSFKVTSVGVQHGQVPALAYLVEAGGRRIAFAGDQGGENPAFAAMIKGADILIMDHAVPEDAPRAEAALHDRPSEIGALAKKAEVKHLVLSHNMGRSLKVLPKNLALIHAVYPGRTTVARDLMCVE